MNILTDLPWRAVFQWVGRHLTLILLFAAIAVLGGLRTEQLDTFKAAALAELVALLLSHIALYIFSNDNYHGAEARDARTRIFLAVHLLVGLVYAGSYFVEFAPGQ